MADEGRSHFLDLSDCEDELAGLYVEVEMKLRKRSHAARLGIQIAWRDDEFTRPLDGRTEGFGKTWNFQICTARVFYRGRLIGSCEVNLVESDSPDKEKIARGAVRQALGDALRFLKTLVDQRDDIEKGLKDFIKDYKE